MFYRGKTYFLLFIPHKNKEITMSEENLEQQTNATSETQQPATAQENQAQQNTTAPKYSAEFLQGLSNFVVNRYNEGNNKIANRQTAIEKNLAGYDSKNYSKNQDFMNLYTEAFDALGDKLDTKKFIGLVDKYVASMVAAKQKEQSAKDENNSLTDSFEHQNGTSAKTGTKLRFQDVPREEWSKYLDKLIH